MENRNKIIKAGLVGYPLDYSISPAIHEFLFEQAGREGEYREFRIKPEVFDERISQIMNDNPYLNITIPYKKDIISHLQGVSDSARIMGVVNSVANELGYNTDGQGMLLAMSDWEKPDKVLIIGAGNTSRTALYTMIEMEVPHIYIIHRNVLSLQKLKKDLIKSLYVDVESSGTFKIPDSNQHITFFNKVEEILEVEQKIDLLLNTTSGGMYPKIDELPLKRELIDYILNKSMPKVFDVIYNPVKTKLLLLAEENGLEYKNGLAMLFYQAYASHVIWFNDEYSVKRAEKLWSLFRKKFEPEEHIKKHFQIEIAEQD